MPDILHCNDWQTALVPIYLKDAATRWWEIRHIRTVFTIHNIEYQGRYGSDSVDQLFGLDRGWYDDGTLRMDGDVNLMKGAMLMADAVTTVSPTYAAQLHDPAYAEGLESVVDAIGWKCMAWSTASTPSPTTRRPTRRFRRITRRQTRPARPCARHPCRLPSDLPRSRTRR